MKTLIRAGSADVSAEVVEAQNAVELPSGKSVGAAVQTTRLMAYACGKSSPWGASEAAKDLALNPSTCFNLIQTLLSLGWLGSAETGGRSKRYMLGPAFVNLLHGVAVRKVDFAALMPYLQEYADRWKVTATVWRRQSLTRMELVAIASCQTSINVQMPIGQRLPILMGGMGRVLALRVGLDPDLREQLFESLRWDRTLSYEQFMVQARKAQRLGWGVDDGFMNRAVTALAVPVPAPDLEKDGGPGHDAGVKGTEYVCSATMFRHQYSSAVLPDLAAALMSVAQQAGKVIYGSA